MFLCCSMIENVNMGGPRSFGLSQKLHELLNVYFYWVCEDICLLLFFFFFLSYFTVE